MHKGAVPFCSSRASLAHARACATGASALHGTDTAGDQKQHRNHHHCCPCPRRLHLYRLCRCQSPCNFHAPTSLPTRPRSMCQHATHSHARCMLTGTRPLLPVTTQSGRCSSRPWTPRTRTSACAPCSVCVCVHVRVCVCMRTFT